LSGPKKTDAPDGCHNLENKFMKTKILQKTFLSLTAGFAALFTLVVSASTAFSLTFTTIDVPGAAWTYAYGINNRGQIVGTFTDFAGSGYHGFLLDKGSFITIDPPGATGGTEAGGINELGQIVGEFADASGQHGFLLDKGSFITIQEGRLAGTADCEPSRKKLRRRSETPRFCSAKTKNLSYLRLPRRSLGIGGFPYVQREKAKTLTGDNEGNKDSVLFNSRFRLLEKTSRMSRRASLSRKRYPP
jgi:probable HAF family extracellular repeat protein